MVAQLDILETMTPLEFLSFRDRLESGSGFQSHQFRELEFALGLEGPEGAGPLSRRAARPARRLERRLAVAARSGMPSCATWPPTASRCPGPTSSGTSPGGSSPRPRCARRWSRSTGASPALAELCERLVDLDEGIMEWRYRHVKMVQRTIGTRRGTGGSAGADYLLATLNQPLFPDLWAIRTEF